MKKTILTVFFLILSIFTLSSCTLSGKVFMDKYLDSDKYNKGSMEYTGELKKIDCIWHYGSIKLIEDTTLETIKVVEENELEDRLKVHSYFENGILYIKYWESGLNFLLKNAKNDKELTIYYPSLNVLNMVLSNSTLDIDNINAKTINIISSGGDINIGSLNSIETFITNSKGEIKIDNYISEEGNISSTKKEITINNIKAGKLSIESTSGDTTLSFIELKEELTIVGTSGKTTIDFNGLGFTLSFAKTKGNLVTDLEYEINDDDDYVFGDGVIEFNCLKTKGDLIIK